MKAVQLTGVGVPENVLHVQEVPQPEPRWGHVRVRMKYAPINPSDVQFIRGNYGKTPTVWPAFAGFEGFGVVEANGGGLLGRFRKGKRVAVLSQTGGTWAEQVVTQAKQVIPIPDELSDEQAAMFFVNPATALVMTRSVLQVPKGAWLMQTAANSALGKMVIRLGKTFGFRTVNIVRREEAKAELLTLGADAVIVYQAGELQRQLREATAEQDVRFVLDPVGGTMGSEAIACLGINGRALSYGSLSLEPLSVEPRFLISGQRRVEGFWLSQWAQRQRIVTMLNLIRKIKRMIQSGVLQSEIGQVFPMTEIAAAVRMADQPGKSGKVLLKLDAEG